MFFQIIETKKVPKGQHNITKPMTPVVGKQKQTNMRKTILTFLLFSLAFNVAIAQENKEDKTLSPYFFVKSDDKSVEQLPLLSTDADVNIAGVIANIKVT